MKVIAIEDTDTWPVEAVLADLDDPEGPLLRWRQGPRADATTLDVQELLGDGSWRFVDLDLPPNWEDGYVASWRGKVAFVRGTPQPVPPLPRWMLTIPNPDRTKRRVRFASRVCAVIGLFGLTGGTLLIIAGAPGGWFNTVWSVVLLWQAWALAGHGRESVRFVAIRLIPLLFFVIALLVTGAAAIRTLAQDANIGRGVAFGCAALLDLFLVTFMARLAIQTGLESKEGGLGHGTFLRGIALGGWNHLLDPRTTFLKRRRSQHRGVSRVYQDESLFLDAIL